MPQLETLILDFATPPPPPVTPLVSDPLRTITLPSLTRFHILGLTGDCSLALAHLVLPSLTWLHVDALSFKWDGEDWIGEDTQQLAPYVARNVHLLQGAEPLRSILIGDKGQSAEVLAWTIPDADADVKADDANLSFRASDLARLLFTNSNRNILGGKDTRNLRRTLNPTPCEFRFNSYRAKQDTTQQGVLAPSCAKVVPG